MKKFFLISAYFPEKYLSNLLEFCKKEQASQVKVLLIENAADVYEETKKWFVYETRDMLKNLWFSIEFCNLAEYFWKTEILQELLKNFDIIWLWWGNTYHLRYCLKNSWFDTLWNFFEENNIILAWGSAGSIVYSPSLAGYETVDSPNLAREYITNWVGWFPKQIIPHWNHPKFQSELERIEKTFQNSKKEYITLGDNNILIGTQFSFTIL